MKTSQSRIISMGVLLTAWGGTACNSNSNDEAEVDAASCAVDGSLRADATADASDAAVTDSTADAAQDGAVGDAAVADAAASPLAALPGYSVSVLLTGGTTYKQPDSIEVDGPNLWVGYQMGVVSKDGTDAGAPFNSEVVQYKLADGTPTGKSFAIPGHCDGVRVNPTTHVVWATSNEDGNPIVMSFDPAADGGTTTTYTLAAPTAHGGGFDDLAFFDGQMIVADSNPVNLTDAGVNTAPALSIMNVSSTTITLSPFLQGNAVATSLIDQSTVSLNLLDPDSLTIDTSGNLVLVDQGDSQLVFVSPPSVDAGADAGAVPGQVSVLPVGTQLDDTVWATKATGFLLVADTVQNTIYKVQANFVPGAVFTEAPNDSLVTNFVGTVDLKTGAINPVIIGFGKASGLLFVAQ